LRFASDPDAAGDFHRFPPLSGEVTHEAMIGRVVF